jgi:hypothetical protein
MQRQIFPAKRVGRKYQSANGLGDGAGGLWEGAGSRKQEVWSNRRDGGTHLLAFLEREDLIASPFCD